MEKALVIVVSAFFSSIVFQMYGEIVGEFLGTAAINLETQNLPTEETPSALIMSAGVAFAMGFFILYVVIKFTLWYCDCLDTEASERS